MPRVRSLPSLLLDQYSGPASVTLLFSSSSLKFQTSGNSTL